MKRDHTARASSRENHQDPSEHNVVDSDNEAMNKEAAIRKRLSASNLDALMAPGVRYTCVALANQLNSTTRQVRASLSQLVRAGTIRHVQEARIGRYWVPTNDEKRQFEQTRRERRKPLSHMLEGYDSDLRRIQSLCMLVRRS